MTNKHQDLQKKDKAQKKNTRIYPGKPNREKPNKPSYRDDIFREQREEKRGKSL